MQGIASTDLAYRSVSTCVVLGPSVQRPADLRAQGAPSAPRWVSSFVRLTYRSPRQIAGADPVLDPDASPLNETEIVSARYVDGWFGTNMYIPSGPLAGQRVSVEIGYPLYVDINTLRSRWYLTAGWQYSFRLTGR